MKTITDLPNEILEIILSYSDITVEDIFNLRRVCKRFQITAKYDKFMERKFSHRWPSAKTFYNLIEDLKKKFKEDEQKDIKPINFKEAGINILKLLRNYISHIIYRHYYDKILFNKFDEISIDNLIEFDINFLKSHIHECNIYIHNDESIKKCLNGKLLFDEVNNLCKQSPRTIGRDFIEKFCNIKQSHYENLRTLKKNRDIFLEKPSKMQLLEMTAIYIAQFLQPQKNVSYSKVRASLDEIGVEVQNCLREKHPDHPIFSMSNETLYTWRENNIDIDYWNGIEGDQIVNTLNEYMFDKLKFQLCKKSNTDLKYICIDNILKNKCGEEIVVYIIYHSVARRLGLLFDIIPRGRYDTIMFWKRKDSRGGCFKIYHEKILRCSVYEQLLSDHFGTLQISLYNKYVINAVQMWELLRAFILILIKTHEIPWSNIVIANI